MAAEEGEKRRFSWTAIFSLIAVLYAIAEALHGGLERQISGLTAFEAALKQVDVIGLSGAFIDGVRGYVPTELNLWTPWAELLAGLHGMWSAMTAGGWLTIASGLLVLASGIGLFVVAGANFESDNEWLRSVAVAVAVFVGVVTVAGVGVVVNLAVSHLFGSTGFGAWLAADQDAFGRLVYGAPPPPPSAGTLLDRINALTLPAAPVAVHGDYRAAAHAIVPFFREHWLFAIEILAMGAAVSALLVALVQASEAGIVLTAFVPFVAMALIALGAGVAFVVDHIIGVYAIKWAISFAAAPFGIAAVGAVLDGGHLVLSFVESTRKLVGRE